MPYCTFLKNACVINCKTLNVRRVENVGLLQVIRVTINNHWQEKDLIHVRASSRDLGTYHMRKSIFNHACTATLCG